MYQYEQSKSRLSTVVYVPPWL